MPSHTLCALLFFQKSSQKLGRECNMILCSAKQRLWYWTQGTGDSKVSDFFWKQEIEKSTYTFKWGTCSLILELKWFWFGKMFNRNTIIVNLIKHKYEVFQINKNITNSILDIWIKPSYLLGKNLRGAVVNTLCLVWAYVLEFLKQYSL